MPFELGGIVNNYVLTDKLGEGGMGTVYAADDTSLQRRVAIKVLPADLASNSERLERFELEARTVASLNHPNVVTLYTVEEFDGTRFLTMELVDGEPLSALIDEAGLPLDEFFRIALPLVEAVASAHARGITHRDLKPGNIMVDREGRVKVLDFGLAKLTEGHPLVSDSDSQAPTDALTGGGQIVGTVAYMSPEQAEGRPVDARADIFALGVLFYEMITGRTPFDGDSPVSVLSAILRVEPEPVTFVRRNAPRQLQRILDRCLAKDRNRRFQTALDLRNALDSLKDELRAEQSGSGERFFDLAEEEEKKRAAVEPASEVGNRTRTLVGAVALLAAGAVAGGVFVGSVGRTVVVEDAATPSTPPPAMLDPAPLVTEQDQLPAAPVFTPAEDAIVYSADRDGQRDLFSVPIEGGEPVVLADSPESETDPTYSPDGETIAYAVTTGPEQGIYLRPADGRGVLVLEGGTRPAYSPTDDVIAYVKDGAIWLAEGPDHRANQRQLTNYLSGPVDPAWSPDGEALFVWSEAALDVLRWPLDSVEGEPLGLVPTGEQVGSLQVSGDGSTMILTRGQYGGHMNIWSVPLDPTTGAVVGPARQLTPLLSDDRDAAVSFDGSTVAFVARDIERHLVARGVDPATGMVTTDSRSLTRRAPLNYYPALSRRGTALSWTAHGRAGFLYRMDLSNFAFGETFSRVEEKVTAVWDPEFREINPEFLDDDVQLLFATTAGGSYHLRQSLCPGCTIMSKTTPGEDDADYYPSRSPDGSLIAFTSNREGSEDIWIVPADGGEPRQLTNLPGSEQYPIWSPDGENVIFRSAQNRDPDLWTIPIDGGFDDARPLLRLPGDQTWAAWSSDSQRLYFVSNESGAYEIWMWQPAPGGDPVQVTRLASTRGGLPAVDMFTKFAIAGDLLITPVETVSGELWLLDLSR